VVAEIEAAAAAGSGIGRSSMLCPGERRRLRGAGSPWVVRATGEDEESPGKVSTGVKGAPSTCDGAAAGSSTRRRAHEGRKVQGVSGYGKGHAGDRFRVL
jgi:hypothetical protein